MSAKSIFIILLTVALTLILMKNTDDMSFWIFGEAQIPKLAILGSMFFLGWMIGFLMGRPKAKVNTSQTFEGQEEETDGLSEEDREYIR